MDGKAKAFPTCYAGAVRIRALTGNQVFGTAEGQVVLPIEARSEPRLQILGISGVNVEKATDDKDQRLSQAVDSEPAILVAPGGGVIMNRRPLIRRFVPGTTGQVFPLHLKKADKVSSTLKELSGTLTATVLLPPEPTITADNILKAAGKTFKGKDGSSFVVKEVTPADDKLTLTVEMGTVNRAAVPIIGPVVPPMPPPLPAPAPQAGGLFQFQQAVPIQAQPRIGVIRPRPLPTPLPTRAMNGWTLLDDKGHEIPLRMSSVRAVMQMPGQVAYTYNLTFIPQKDQVPAKLAFTSSRNLTLDIPFTLKDVPLP